MTPWTSPRPRRVSLHLWIYRQRVAILASLAGVLVAGLLVVGYFTHVVVKRFDGRRWNLPSRIYSDMAIWRVGDGGSPERLARKLERLLYQETEQRPERSGWFRRSRNAVEVYTRPFQYPGRSFPELGVRIEYAGGLVKSLASFSGERLEALVVEPELLGSVFGEEFEDRTLVRLADVPKTLTDAILVTEDRDFYRHAGVSLRRSLGAVISNLKGGAKQGGSTLTQQLVKNLYLSPERTLKRKAVEAIMAVILDGRYSKDEIFEAYLNEIYLGQHGSIAITGVGEAARFYFGKPVSDLDLAESATLAGMIKAPNVYSPARNPEKARQRRDLVLRLMREEGRIDETALQGALAESVSTRSRRPERTIAPHFVDFVKAELAERYGEKLRTEGLQIYTTLDVDLQQAGQRAVTDGLAGLEKNYRRLAAAAKEEPLQGALIGLEPGTGAVRVFVGGRDYRLSQFNRVTQAHRQPGSLFKPFVFVAAFGRRDLPEPITPATIFNDSPITVEWDERAEDQVWSPRNYDGDFRGPLSARRALELSINIPTVRAALAAGLPMVVGAARAAGIGSRLRAYPSVALGAFEISPIEIASAFAVLANSGVRVRPVAIVGVQTSDGAVLDRKETPMEPALPADAVFLVNSLLRGAVDRGTAAGARAGGIRGVLAGKTGTTNDGRDAWFVGFSPRFLAAIWVGYDDNRALHLSGSQAAVPIFADFSKALPPQYFDANFPVPSDIVTAEIDPETGLLATSACPARVTEVFIAGTEPKQDCTLHRGFLRSFLRSLFQ
ncbi:MAG TPA: PBP1A family penicillin-binding protein [Thermoanaerobaculia bacterium]|nr:PBP1A family penicillin-binding protein [Thermoanaerobaculia bacterium]